MPTSSCLSAISRINNATMGLNCAFEECNSRCSGLENPPTSGIWRPSIIVPAYEAECLRSRDLGPEPGGLIFAEKVFELIFVRDEVSYFLVE